MTDVKHRFQGHGCPSCAMTKRALSSQKKHPISDSYNLSVLYPDLSQEWSIERNDGVLPHMVTPGTRKKVWWDCHACHNSWCASVSSRVHGSGCPFCSGRQIVPGINDLASLHPDLLNEWNFDKNINIDPHSCASNSHQLVWWRCSICGFEWQANISDRSRGTGCPHCLFSKRTSEPEQILFFYFSQLFPDAVNSYRPSWGRGHGAEFDIYIPSLKLGIEYDGEHWHKDIAKDQKKDADAAEHGITLFRFREQGCPELHSTSICVPLSSADWDKKFICKGFEDNPSQRHRHP